MLHAARPTARSACAVHGVRIPVRHYPQREPQLQPQLSQIQSHPHLQRRGFLNIFGSANPEPKPQPKEGTVPITKIGMELLSQDPKNRITFAGAGFFTLKSRLPWSRQKTAVDVVGMFPPGVVRYTPELLPFWMTTVLMEVTYQVEMDPETINDRRTTRRSGIVSGVHKCSIGATICATEPGHWAHGIMFKDSIADMITTIGNVFPVQDIRVYCDGSEEVDGRFSTPLDLLPMDIDPTITPRFAFGPPLFSDFASQSQLLDQLYFGPPSITVTYSKLREMTSFAIPQYRLVYRAEMKDGSTAMFDATGSSLNGFKILPADDTCSVNRRLDDQMIYDEDSSPGESPEFLYYQDTVDEDADENGFRQNKKMMVIPSLIREDMRNTFQETMVKEMVKSPVSDAVWAHPRIFSGFRDDHAPHGMGIQSLVRYTTKWIKNSQAGPYIWDTVGVNKSSDPAERIKPGETRAERRAREKAGREKREQAAAARAARDRAAKLRAEAESAEREELLRQQLARQRDRLRDHHTSREQMLNSRLEKLMSNQTAWAERFQRKDGGRVAPAPKVSDVPIILDTRKYYATLGVTPGPELLDEKDENKINDMLKGRMYALTRQYHPDRALNAADEDRRNKMMAHINVAYAHVETLAWRRFYHDPIKNPDPSKRAASKP